jgi:Domain of unknown function (DUF1906)
MDAIDTSAKTTGQANSIAAAGYGAVGVYLRPDRCDAAMIAELHAAGLKVWSIYERGYPDHDAYFSAHQGTIDGTAATAFASSMGQPNGTQIYATIDYNPDAHDATGPTINGQISAYMNAFRTAIQPAGYLASVYGSGRTCRILMASGFAKTGWLSVSSSFAEYAIFKPQAGIAQLGVINGDWDSDEIRDPTVVGLW